jgi:hypothetical protein
MSFYLCFCTGVKVGFWLKGKKICDLRVFEKVLKGIFGRKKEETTGE